jgi:hypothetical protein
VSNRAAMRGAIHGREAAAMVLAMGAAMGVV